MDFSAVEAGEIGKGDRTNWLRGAQRLGLRLLAAASTN
jgi:hypothetical protein